MGVMGEQKGGGLLKSRAVRYLFAERRLLVMTGAVLLAQALIVALIPLPLKYLVDDVLLRTSGEIVTLSIWGELQYLASVEQIIVWIVSILAVLGALSVFLDYFQELAVAKTSAKVIERVRKDVLHSLVVRKLSFFDRERKIDILARMSGDAANINFLVASVLTAFLRSFPTMLLVLASMLLLEARFALILGLTLPVAIYLSHRFTLRARALIHDFRRKSVRLETDFYELLQAFPLIKSLRVENRIVNRIDGQVKRVGHSLVEAEAMQGLVLASLSGSKHLMRFFVVIVGSYLVLQRTLSVGELVVFLSYIELLTKPIGEVAKLSNKLARAQVSIARLESLFQRMDNAESEQLVMDIPDRESGSHSLRNWGDGPQSKMDRLKVGEPALEWKNIDLLVGGTVQVCQGLSGKISNGQVVVLAGPSGAGKSSFAKIFNRLLDLRNGEVRLYGEDIATIPLSTLRRRVCLLSQESYFVHGTIRENLDLAVDCPVGDAAMRAALQKVNALEFVDDLEHGLDTMVGEGGRVLSGGQVRRLNLARAFLRSDADVYIFDEASSGLDPESADIVFESGRELARSGKTVLWVTHREKEIRSADAVLHFRIAKNPVWSGELSVVRGEEAYV